MAENVTAEVTAIRNDVREQNVMQSDAISPPYHLTQGRRGVPGVPGLNGLAGQNGFNGETGPSGPMGAQLISLSQASSLAHRLF